VSIIEANEAKYETLRDKGPAGRRAWLQMSLTVVVSVVKNWWEVAFGSEVAAAVAEECLARVEQREEMARRDKACNW